VAISLWRTAPWSNVASCLSYEYNHQWRNKLQPDIRISFLQWNVAVTLQAPGRDNVYMGPPLACKVSTSQTATDTRCVPPSCTPCNVTHLMISLLSSSSSEQIGVAVTFYICILEAYTSNIDRVEYSKQGFPFFSSVSPGEH